MSAGTVSCQVLPQQKHARQTASCSLHPVSRVTVCQQGLGSGQCAKGKTRVMVPHSKLMRMSVVTEAAMHLHLDRALCKAAR